MKVKNYSYLKNTVTRSFEEVTNALIVFMELYMLNVFIQLKAKGL